MSQHDYPGRLMGFFVLYEKYEKLSLRLSRYLDWTLNLLDF